LSSALTAASSVESSAAKRKWIDVDFQGLALTIEFKKGEIKPSGDSRSDPYDGWMIYADYGYIKDTVSPEEGEEMDCYVGPDKESQCVFQVELLNEDGSFNEHKILLGFADLKAAKDFFSMQYGTWRTGAFMETTVRDISDLASISWVKNEKEKKLFAPDPAPAADPSEKQIDNYGQTGDQPALVIMV
jgi:hypothetical protein